MLYKQRAARPYFQGKGVLLQRSKLEFVWDIRLGARQVST